MTGPTPCPDMHLVSAIEKARAARGSRTALILSKDETAAILAAAERDYTRADPAPGDEKPPKPPRGIAGGYVHAADWNAMVKQKNEQLTAAQAEVERLKGEVQIVEGCWFVSREERNRQRALIAQLAYALRAQEDRAQRGIST